MLRPGDQHLRDVVAVVRLGEGVEGGDRGHHVLQDQCELLVVGGRPVPASQLAETVGALGLGAAAAGVGGGAVAGRRRSWF